VFLLALLITVTSIWVLLVLLVGWQQKNEEDSTGE
jgi:hypothetical protein